MDRVSPDLSKARNENVYTVREDEEGTRLDVFLRKRVPWRSRQHLQARVREREVLVNGEPAKVSLAMRAGDQVWLSLIRDGAPFDPADIPLSTIYEDEFLLALDKPAGYVVHPVGRHQMDTIINALHLRYRRPGDPERDIVPKLAHRLDQHTSGVLLVAKRDDVRAELGRQFAFREIEKEYAAIVTGGPDPTEGEVEAPIGKNLTARNGLPMQVRDDGEPSLTLYRTMERFSGHSFIRLRPKSGRTHQIRVHLRWLGCPLVADPMYGTSDPLVIGDEVLLTRYPLHSARIEFTHPVSGERMKIEAPLPEDMERALSALRVSGKEVRPQ